MGTPITIYGALSKYLADMPASSYSTICTALSVAGENTGDKPVSGTPYLELAELPATPVPRTLGKDGLVEFSGVFQVTAVFPFGEGWGRAFGIADVLCTRFKRGTVITSGTTRVTCKMAWRNPGYQDGKWWRVPVSVLYQCYAKQE